MNKKNQFQDIVPPPKRSIRDIPLPANRKPQSVPSSRTPLSTPPSFSPVKSAPKGQPPLPPPKNIPPDYSFGESKRGWRPGLWLLVLIALIVLFFGVSYFFAGATVIVTLKNQAVEIDQNLAADKNGDNETIPYSLITLEREGGTEVAGDGEENVSKKASGQIVIYNAYGPNPQPLIATTQFETPEGLIFRIDKNITVPGQVTVNGKVTPGSLEATVYADLPGEKYNVGLKDFTIVGFKGTSKYQGFYARSKTPLQGGFVGTMKKVSDQDLQSARSTIEKNLKQELLTQAKAQKPDDFVLFNDSLIINFSQEPNTSSTNNKVTVKEKARAYAIVFNRDILTSYLLTHSVNANVASTTISGIEDLAFSLKNPESFNPNQASTTRLSFALSGSVKLMSIVDQDDLKIDLKGVSRNKLASILTNYPSIEKAEVIFRPFWRWSFPDETADIKIEIKEPK